MYRCVRSCVYLHHLSPSVGRSVKQCRYPEAELPAELSPAVSPRLGIARGGHLVTPWCLTSVGETCEEAVPLEASCTQARR